MALISCPECGKDISDRVKSCPNCGYPLVEENDGAQKVELTSVSLKMEEGKRKSVATKIIGVLVIVALAFSSYYLVSGQQAKTKAVEYRRTVDTMIAQMLSSGSSAEDLLNLTQKVWYNAIYEKSEYETIEYTRGATDFNDALANLRSDGEVKAQIIGIESSQTTIAEMMKQLQNPPEEYKNSYPTMLELYGAYQGITDLAINPTGSLSSFGTSKREKIDKFVELLTKVRAQLPTQTEST